MLDSLDLMELRQQVEEDKKQEKRRSRLSWSIVIGSFMMAFLVPIVYSAIKPVTTETPLVIFLGPLPLFGAIGLALNFWIYRPDAHLYRRAEECLPSFVAKPKPSLDRMLIFYCTIFFIIVVGAIFSLLPPIWMIIVGLSPLPYGYIWRQIYQWVRSGNQQERLKRSEFLLRFLPHNILLRLIRANTLFHSGQTEQAIKIYSAVLSDKQHPLNLLMTTACLNDLGYLLVLDKQFEESLLLLESAIRISPQVGSFYDSLAAYYLEQGIYPERALELTQTAIEYTPKQFAEAHVIQKATSARAWALTKFNPEADALLNEVLPKIKSLPAPIQAEVYRQAGYTRRAQGDESAAREFFNKAVELDPDGLYGKLARQALDSTSSN